MQRELKITDSAIVSTVRTSNAYKNDLNEKVSADSIISTINQSAESITIQANKIGLLGETNIPDLTTNKIKGGTLTLGGGTIGQNGEQVVYDENDNVIIKLNKDGMTAYSGTLNVVETIKAVTGQESEVYNNLTIKSEEIIAHFTRNLGEGNVQWRRSILNAFYGLHLESHGISYGFNNYDLGLTYSGIVHELESGSHAFYVGDKYTLFIEESGLSVNGNINFESGTTFRYINMPTCKLRDNGNGSLVISSNGNDKAIYLRPLGDMNNGSATIINSNGMQVLGNIESENITILRYTAVDRHRGRTVADQFYIGSGNCRIDTSGGNIRLYTTPVGSSDSGIYIGTDGSLQVKVANVSKHIFYGSGTKSGGSIEIEGTTYGMSPVDSPQLLIEDVLFGVYVDGRTEIKLDNIFAKSISRYAVFSSCGQVEIVEKGADYFIVDGYTGTVDFRVVGKRINEEHRYFEIMGGFTHGVEEEVISE